MEAVKKAVVMLYAYSVASGDKEARDVALEIAGKVGKLEIDLAWARMLLKECADFDALSSERHTKIRLFLRGEG